MKIAFPTSGNTLDAPLNLTFGRAPKFLVYDAGSEEISVIDNQQNLNAAQGAGIQSAETVARLGAEVVVTGSVGPKAYKALRAAGIRIALIEAVCPGTEALRRFKDNELPVLDQPNGESHWV